MHRPEDYLALAPNREANTAEYPRGRRAGPYGDAIAQASAALNFGRLTILPYHIRHGGLLGVVRVWSYAPTPVTMPGGYDGEAFLRMMVQVSARHPSGLPDAAIVRPGR